MFPAGLDVLAGEALSDFYGLRDAAPFRYESRDFGTRAEVSTAFESLDADSDSDFFNFGDVFLPLHGRLFLVQPTTACCLLRFVGAIALPS